MNRRMVGLAVALAAACGDAGPWYDTAPSPDLSYLPLGAQPFGETPMAWTDADGSTIAVDCYIPDGAGPFPAVVMLPGAFVVKERYRWLGATLASHGVATLIVQPNGAFSTSRFTTGTVAAAVDQGLPIDLSRVALAGHSAGAIPQVGLTEVASCPPGFCDDGTRTPPGLRAMILLGYHNQLQPDADAPMPAAEIPWLIVNGTRDGLATPDKTRATLDRLQDRPVYGVAVDGMNHFQLTDYVDLATDQRLDADLEPTVGNRAARAAAAEYIARFARRYLFGDESIADDLGAAGDARVAVDYRASRIEAPRGHGMPRVMSEPIGAPGLDDGDDTADIVATEVFQNERYLLVRNDELGAEVWKLGTNGAVAAVPFPGGVTHGFYGNRRLNGLLGDMKVFRGELYVGLSSGVQGAARGSTGAELWAYDGQTWRPVVSNLADADPELRLGACTPGARAELAFPGAGWRPGQWAGAVIDDLGSPDAGTEPLQLPVVDNTADALVVELDEIAGEPERFDCTGLAPNHRLYLRSGADENGFGQPWNKAIIALAVLGDRLFIGTGLNDSDGAEVWVTSDGTTFELAVPRETFGRHADGAPKTSSISAMHVSDVTGEAALYIGAAGDHGYGARVLAYRADDSVRFLNDNDLDADDVGLDEAGFGGGAQQVSSIATFAGRLWVAGFNFAGMELMSMDSAGRWRRDVGDGAAFPPGWGDDSQLAARLFVARGELWAADIAFIQSKGELADTSAYVWRTRDGQAWQLATAHAFGINHIKVSQIFEHDGTLHAVASSGALSTLRTYRPLRLYTLEDTEE